MSSNSYNPNNHINDSYPSPSPEEEEEEEDLPSGTDTNDSITSSELFSGPNNRPLLLIINIPERGGREDILLRTECRYSMMRCLLLITMVFDDWDDTMNCISVVTTPRCIMVFLNEDPDDFDGDNEGHIWELVWEIEDDLAVREDEDEDEDQYQRGRENGNGNEDCGGGS